MKGGSDGPPSLYHSHRIVVRSGDPRPGNERSGSRFGDGRVRTTDRRWDDVPKQTGAGGAARSWNGVTQRPWAARSWGRALPAAAPEVDWMSVGREFFLFTRCWTRIGT
jgi:hypothetical protein